MSRGNEPAGPCGEDPRVRMAAERTLLAWIRTGLAMMGFGFVVARFGLFLSELAAASNAIPTRHLGWSLWIGTALVLVGAAAVLTATVQHVRVLRRLSRGEAYQPPRVSLSVIGQLCWSRWVGGAIWSPSVADGVTFTWVTFRPAAAWLGPEAVP